MPGSTIASVLSSPYLTPWSYSTTGGGGSGTWADSTNSTFTVASHPFVTGDVMYVKLFTNGVLPFTSTQKYYAIVVSPTQLKYASSYANAIAGTSLAIPASLATNVQSAIGNHPNIGYGAALFSAGFYNPATWMASSISTVSFASTENVQIDFTLVGSGDNPMSASLFTKSLSYVCGFFQSNSSQSVAGEGSSTLYGGSVLQNTSQILPAVVRFTLQNRRVNIAVKLNNNSYLTRLAGSLLATNLDPLFFAINMGINGYNANNCTITYL